MIERFVKIAAVGDIMLGDRPLMVGLGVRSYIEGSSQYDPFSYVSGILKEHDIVFGNLESVLSDSGMIQNNYESVQMRGTKESINFLKSAGFNVMSVANNHIMQHGNEAFFETVNLLRDNGIAPIGCSYNNGKSLPFYKTLKGITFGFAGFSMRPEKYNQNANYAQSEFKEILNSVKIYKKNCDFLTISLHWGDEYVFWPSKEQIKQARALVDHGVSLIIGHHPHVIQGVERYNEGIIAYSMGNFVFDIWQRRLRQSFILVIELDRSLIPTFKRIPVYIDSEFRPMTLCGELAFGLRNRIVELDRLIEYYPKRLLPYGDGYLEFVKINGIRNKIENRALFISKFFKYQSWVRRQSLLWFLKNRSKFI